MNRLTTLSLLRGFAAVTIAVAVGGCNTLSRLSEVGDGPKLSTIENPVAAPNYRPVSLPMPAPVAAEVNPNSLWRTGAKAFFKDQRAKEVGDILTVSLDIDDDATLDNTTDRSRADRETADITNLLGLEAELAKKLPEAIDATAVANFGNDHATNGDGNITRSELISVTVAAVITQILPNGNLVIDGRQEIRVNNELRELRVSGIIRPSDIDPANVIEHTKIAEMRVAYGGRGNLSDLQQPRWGTQVWDIVFPF